MREGEFVALSVAVIDMLDVMLVVTLGDFDIDDDVLSVVNELDDADSVKIFSIMRVKVTGKIVS